MKTRETCLQFGSEARHSVPKITWGSFRGQRENKWGSFRGQFGDQSGVGDHFGGCTGRIVTIKLVCYCPIQEHLAEELARHQVQGSPLLHPGHQESLHLALFQIYVSILVNEAIDNTYHTACVS